MEPTVLATHDAATTGAPHGAVHGAVARCAICARCAPCALAIMRKFLLTVYE